MIHYPTHTLPVVYSSVDDLLATPPEDLVPVMLGYARQAMQHQNGKFDPNSVNEIAMGDTPIRPEMPRFKNHADRQKVIRHLAEVWSVIEGQRLIMPSPDMNGANGYKIFTAKGEKVSTQTDFEQLRHASSLPKSLLHPLIADSVWNSIMRGDLSRAVFDAFLAVEETVRKDGGFSSKAYGVQLMKDAFAVGSGPLTDKAASTPQQNARQNLFAGSIGAFRNPTAHSTVTFADPLDAYRQVILASQLLSMLDAFRNP
jgi:uncharacterized protein (TIGR02391 family)